MAACLGPDVEAVECDVADDAVDRGARCTCGSARFAVITAVWLLHLVPGVTILRVNLIGTAKLLDVFEPAVNPGSVVVCFASIAGH